MSVLLSQKLRLVGATRYRHWCPGCKEHHEFYVGEPAPRTGAIWYFNGNILLPTFTPSMHITAGPSEEPPGHPDHIPKISLCHYFLTAGVLVFQNDCEHDLKGQSVILPDLPKWNF